MTTWTSTTMTRWWNITQGAHWKPLMFQSAGIPCHLRVIPLKFLPLPRVPRRQQGAPDAAALTRSRVWTWLATRSGGHRRLQMAHRGAGGAEWVSQSRSGSSSNLRAIAVAGARLAEASPLRRCCLRRPGGEKPGASSGGARPGLVPGSRSAAPATVSRAVGEDAQRWLMTMAPTPTTRPRLCPDRPVDQRLDGVDRS